MAGNIGGGREQRLRRDAMERIINSFSHEWKDLIRIILCFEEPLVKAEKWLQKVTESAGRLGHVSHNVFTSIDDNVEDEKSVSIQGWYNLIYDLIEEIPFASKSEIINKHRIFLLPAIPQKNLLIFISQNRQKIDEFIYEKLRLFLYQNIDEFSEWCRYVILQRLLSHKGIDNDNIEGVMARKDYFAIDSTCFKEGDIDGLNWLSKTSKEYLNAIKKYYNSNGIKWKECNFCDDEAMNQMENNLEESRKLNIKTNIKEKDSKNDLNSFEDVSVLDGDEIPMKKAKIEEENKPDSKSDNRNLESGIIVIKENYSENDDYEKNRLYLEMMAFKELMQKYQDFNSLCNQLNIILSESLYQIEVVCHGLQVETFTESELVHFVKCICSEQVTITSNLKKTILQRTLLSMLLSLDKTASRQVYNCVIDLLQCNNSECLESVIVSLVFQSTKNSPQEDFALKILKSDSLNDCFYNNILQTLIDSCKKGQEVAESFVKTLEIILVKGLTIPSELLLDIVNILQSNSTKFEQFIGIPKIVLIMIKQYKKEVAEFVRKVEALLQTNQSFLKKTALKELTKITDKK